MGVNMGWSIGHDSKWNRDIGYGVPAKCDHPGCNTIINRGLPYVCCGQSPYGGDGCGLYFCFEHSNMDHKCERCVLENEPFNPTEDIPEWINWKLKDKSWSNWRKENKQEVKRLKDVLKGITNDKN
jgi:hypothetical protein